MTAITKIQTDDASVTALVRDCLAREVEGKACRTSYLRTLIAAVQVALGSSPRLIGARGRIRHVAMPEALEALAQVNERFYGIVMQEIPTTLDAKTRNAQSGFARSAASTLRSAIHAGLNPLELVVPSVTKEMLRQWTAEHRPDETPTLALALRRARSGMQRIGAMIAGLAMPEQAEVLEAIRRELEALEAETQRPKLSKAA